MKFSRKIGGFIKGKIAFLEQFSLLRKVPNHLAFLASIIFFVFVILDFAYFPTPEEQAQIRVVYRTIWVIFLLEMTLRILFKYTAKNHRGLLQKSITTVLLYSTLIPFVFNQSAVGSFLEPVWNFIDNKFYFTFVMLLASFGNISRSVVSLFNKRTNPAMLMAGSFSVIILIGTFLLLSPRCSTLSISFVDALFVATSAVCVTGLTPLDVSTAFTQEGQIIIMLLIQIGGLGVMTLTSFFALFFTGNIGVYNQLTVREMISTGAIHSLVSTLLHILGFTLFIEGMGALGIWFSIHGSLDLSLSQEIFFSVFHSISAFCNAGFSTLGGNLGNQQVMSGHNSLFVIISFLIILGGIGFPILVNLKHLLQYEIKKLIRTKILKDNSFRRISHIINVNTKIVLITTCILVIGGTLLMAFFEWNHAFNEMPIWDKITHSFFNSVSTRTAGFISVNLTLLSMHSLLIYTFLMWVGGAAQSTAGGIKVNTFALAFLSLKSILRNENKVEVFKREISQASINRASGTIFISIMVISMSVFILSLLEPDIAFFKLVFECFSAIGTVGSSLDTTALLGDPAKLLVAFLMFIGRVGIFTIIVSFMPERDKRNYRFPKEDIIIN